MDKDIQRDMIKEYLEKISKSINTEKAYNQFIEIANDKEPSNRSLEESTVFRVFDKYLALKSQMPNFLDAKTILYRARKVDKEKYLVSSKSGISVDIVNNAYRFSGFDEYESKEAPLGVSPVGRNNVMGMPYLYVSEDEYTACSEIQPDIHSLISVASFETLVPLLIIDFREEKTFDELPAMISEQASMYSITQLFTIIMSQFSVPVTDDAEYKASQLFADYIRKAGFDGIRYMSSKSGGANLTIFHSHRSKIRFVKSKLVYVSALECHLTDLNTKEEISPNNCFPKQTDLDYDVIIKKISDKIKFANIKNSNA